jgi:hypothetical protein
LKDRIKRKVASNMGKNGNARALSYSNVADCDIEWGSSRIVEGVMHSEF